MVRVCCADKVSIFCHVVQGLFGHFPWLCGPIIALNSWLMFAGKCTFATWLCGRILLGVFLI